MHTASRTKDADSSLARSDACAASTALPPPSRTPEPAAPERLNMFRWCSVWLRNYRVWRKLAPASLIGNLADPMIYLFGLGMGLGLMLGRVEGVSYISFLAAGTVASSVMMSASFECMYSAFARMKDQRTWEAIMHTPLTLSDVVLGEVAWAASKAFISGAAIVLVAGALGYVEFTHALFALPVIVLVGLCFASLAMIVTSIAPSYDFYMFYQTLCLTPMMLLSGVFFPTSQLTSLLQALTRVLPLAQAIALLRPLLLGGWPAHPWLDMAALAVYTVIALSIALHCFRKRLMH